LTSNADRPPLLHPGVHDEVGTNWPGLGWEPDVTIADDVSALDDIIRLIQEG
jgi:hypothetical protein